MSFLTQFFSWVNRPALVWCLWYGHPVNEFTLTAELEIYPLELGKTDTFMPPFKFFIFHHQIWTFTVRFFPTNKMFPSFKLLVDSLSYYSCGQKPSFLSLSEIHLEIDNLTLINWICWTKVSLFLSTFGFLRVKVTMEFHIVHLHLVRSHCFTKCHADWARLKAV